MIALHQLRTRRPLTIREIEMETGVSRATASRIIHKSKAICCQDDKENYNPNPISLAPPVPIPKSGRLFKFDDKQLTQVVAMATRDASQRRKSWSAIARKLPFEIHRTSVSTILHDAGYTQAIAESKPRLSEKNTAHRLEFSTYWKDIPVRKEGHELEVDSDAFDGWISTDEMHFLVGKHYGPELVTQLIAETERYHRNCVNEELPGQTRIMFWGELSMGYLVLSLHFSFGKRRLKRKRSLRLRSSQRRIDYLRKQQQKRILTGMPMRWPTAELYLKANDPGVD